MKTMEPTISKETRELLAMLRKQGRPVRDVARRRRPSGGRTNPCAEVRLPETVRFINAKNGRARLVKGYADGDLSARFCELVKQGVIPVGQELKGGELTKMIGAKNFNGGWDNFAMRLAANSMPARLRCRKGGPTGNAHVYVVELV